MEKLIKHELLTTRTLRSRIATANEEERLAKHSESPRWLWRAAKCRKWRDKVLPEA
jgi:hypothetical protein